jgi:hypothetical protein
MVRRPQQDIVQRLVRRPEMRRSVLCHGRRAHRKIDVSRSNRRLDIVGIERQGANEEILGSRHD